MPKNCKWFDTFANDCSIAGKTDLFFLHFNLRSLSKNKEKVEEFLENFDRLPNVIAISETKLNSNSISNVNIPNYTFLRNDSSTCAGGCRSLY